METITEQYDDQNNEDDWNFSGFSIHVCLPNQVLIESAAADIEEWLPKQYPYTLPTLRPDFKPLHRGGFSKDWWSLLVCSVEYGYENDAILHLGSAPLWLTVFLPIDITPGPLLGPLITDPDEGDEGERYEVIDCISLPGALVELHRLAERYKLATDRAGLEALREAYNDAYLHRNLRILTADGFVDPPKAEESEECVPEEEGMLRVYAEFMLAAMVAMEEGLPLWVIK